MAMRLFLTVLSLLAAVATAYSQQAGRSGGPGTPNVPVKSISSATYTPAPADYFLCFDPTNNTITINLPVSPQIGKTYIVKDCTGQSGSNPITIVPAGSATIDGAASYLMNSAFANVGLTYTGGQWSLLTGGTSTPSGLFVSTHLYDNNNSGWQSHETTLNATNVSNQMTLLARNITLDEQVDAQPLIAGNNLYIATENNTIYKVDATSGSILNSRHFATPVPSSVSTCFNNSTVIGINSTPVIDTGTGIIYIVVYSYPASVPTYTIYAVDKDTLADRITPHVISVTATLQDATTYSFAATYSRQRAALKVGNGNLYVGFSSFCDFNPSLTRGWIMAFSKTTLSQVSANGYLMNQIHPDPVAGGPYYLTAIWSSGAGPVIDANGSVYVATGNSHSNNPNTTYNQTLNLQESYVKFTPSLTVTDYLSMFNLITLDTNDQDVAAASINLLPINTGNHPNVLMGGGKDGIWRFVDTTNMGHFNGPGGPDLDIANINNSGSNIHGGSAYFTGSDGVLRVAVPNFGSVSTYKITTNPNFSFTHDKDISPGGVGGNLQQGQDGGWFQTISSNGTTAGTHVLWAMTRATGTEPNTLLPTLYAFDPMTGAYLWRYIINDWVSYQGNLNAVPVVANGKVYVAGYKSFFIFGLSNQTPGTPTAYPLDIVPLTANFCYLMTACSAAIKTAGTQKLVAIQNLGTNETCDVIVSSVTGGWGNLANCSGISGGQNATTYCSNNICEMTKWYDQTANGNDVPVTSGPGSPPYNIFPTINTNCVGGLPCVVTANACAGGAGCVSTHNGYGFGLANCAVCTFTLPQSLSTMGFTFYQGLIFPSNRDYVAFGSPGLGLGRYGDAQPGPSTANQIRLISNNSGAFLSNPVAANDVQWHAISALFPVGANSGIVNIDGTETTGIATGVTNPVGTQISVSGPNTNTNDGYMTGAISWQGSITGTQRTNLCHQYYQALYGAQNFGGTC